MLSSSLSSNFSESSVFKPDLFKDKVAFVTGGSGTICRIQAKALASLGCHCAIIGRNPKKAQEAAYEIQNEIKLFSKAQIISIGNVDVRNFKSLQNAVNDTIAKFGKIDFLIAGAAGNFLCDFNHLSINSFKSVVDIDLLGSFNTVKAVFPHLKASKGKIILVSATLQYSGIPLQAPACAAKAGVDALCNNLAVEFGPLGITVNCIAPGAIQQSSSEMTEGMKRLGGENVANLKNKIPLQRLGTTWDVANATCFLFSDAANYITGTQLVVDGGFWHMGYNAINAPSVEKMIELLNDKPRL